MTVASYHSLHVFDHDLSPQRLISNPLFAGIHEVAVEDDSIWVTATAIDLALRVDADGRTLETWWGREDPVIARALGVQPLDVDKNADNRLRYLAVAANEPGHLHLNAIAFHRGRPLLLLNHFGALVRLRPTEVVFVDPTLKGCHNVLGITDDQLLINDTVNRAVRVYGHDGRLQQRIDLTVLPITQSEPGHGRG